MACFFDLDIIYKNKNSELKQEVKKLMNILPQRKFYLSFTLASRRYGG